MIDWKNLRELPRKRRDSTDRERLAEAVHRKRCAKHKGRNHWRNWERRQMALAKNRAKAVSAEVKQAAEKRRLQVARDYWQGLREDLPG